MPTGTVDRDLALRGAGIGGAAPTVAYIGSRGRSGSTLLDRMLSELPGWFGGGEIRSIWWWGVRDDLPCGCGAAFSRCRVWSEVGRLAFGGWSRELADEVLALERSLKRIRYLPYLAFGRPPRWFAERQRRYADVTQRLYHAIAAVTGSCVVVDSSKEPVHATLLARSGLPVKLIHLVRDSRAVTYSWRKELRRRDVGDRHVDMPRDSLPGSVVRYAIYNLLFEALPMIGIPRILMRYESLVAHPKRELARAVSHVGGAVSHADLAFVADGHASLGAHHTVAGNPSKIDRGAIALEVDDEWKGRLPLGHRAVVTLATWPLLVRYGYLRSPGAGTTARNRSPGS